MKELTLIARMSVKSKIICINLAFCLLAACAAYSEDKSEDNLSPVGFYLVSDTPGPGCFELTAKDNKETLFLERTPILTAADLADAEYLVYKVPTDMKEAATKSGIATTLEEGRVAIKFTDEGKEKLHKVTSENLDRRLGIVVDGELITAPVIKMPIGEGKLEMAGNFEEGELKSIAGQIKLAIRKMQLEKEKPAQAKPRKEKSQYKKFGDVPKGD